jgi:hypothetical protein
MREPLLKAMEAAAHFGQLGLFALESAEPDDLRLALLLAARDLYRTVGAFGSEISPVSQAATKSTKDQDALELFTEES